MDLLQEAALQWLAVKQIVAPDPVFRDALHVALGAGLFLALYALLHRLRFVVLLALGIIAMLQGINELFDAAGHEMRVNRSEALSDTALTLAPALLAALALAVMRSRYRKGYP